MHRFSATHKKAVISGLKWAVGGAVGGLTGYGVIKHVTGFDRYFPGPDDIVRETLFPHLK